MEAGKLGTSISQRGTIREGGGDVCGSLLMLLLVWACWQQCQLLARGVGPGVAAAETSWTHPNLCHVSHHSDLQAVVAVTSFLLSMTHTNFPLDNLYCLSMPGILEKVASVYRFEHLKITIENLAFVFHFLHHIFFLSKVIEKPYNYPT